MMLLLFLACNAAHVAKEAADPVAPAPIIAVFPPDGSMQLLGDVPVIVALGANGKGITPTVSAVVNGADAEDLPCTLADDGVWASCGTLDGLGRDDDETSMAITVADESITADGLVDPPGAGIGWDLLDGTTVTKFGGGSEAVTLANQELFNGDFFIALADYAGSPGPFGIVGGPVNPDGSDWVGLKPGFTLVLHGAIDAVGLLRERSAAAWLAIRANDTDVAILITDVTLTGQVAGLALTNMTLTAKIPSAALESVSETLGSLGTEMLDLISLDVDTDGDGVMDAASFEITGEPTPAVLTIWDGG